MLIKIDTSVIKHIKKNVEELNNCSDLIISINEVARSYQKEKHLIIADLSDLEFLSECTLLEQISQQIFTSILNRYYITGNYENLYSEKIILHMNSNRFYRSDYEYWIPADRMKDIKKTALISENLSDCEFYIDLCQCLIRQVEEFKIHSINFHKISSGGSSAYPTAKNELNEDNFVLLIMDSDRQYKNDTQKGSYKKAHKVYIENQDKHVIDLYELNIREKENLVPPSLLLLMENPPIKVFLEFLCRYELEDRNEILRFYNIKDGVKAKIMKNEDKEIIDFYKEFIIDLDKNGLLCHELERIKDLNDDDNLLIGIGDRAIDLFRDDILKEGLSKKIKEKERLINEGFTIPESVISDLKDKKEKTEDIYNYLPKYIKKDWYDLCVKLINWGCCASETQISLNP